MRIPIFLAAAAAVALGACGGDDKSDVERTVRDFVEASSKRDGDRVCDDLVTQEYLERSTFQMGGRATEACKKQIKQLKRGSIGLISLDRTTVKDDTARVRVTLEVQDAPQKAEFRLVKQDGDWRLTSGSG